jgi:hypothetical protein
LLDCEETLGCDATLVVGAALEGLDGDVAVPPASEVVMPDTDEDLIPDSNEVVVLKLGV